MKIILKDKTELAVTEDSTATSINAVFDNADDIEIYRKKMTDENLSEYAFADTDNSKFGVYTNSTLVNVLYIPADNEFKVTYTLRQYSDIEVRLNAIEKEQGMQSDAIATMSESLYAE